VYALYRTVLFPMTIRVTLTTLNHPIFYIILYRLSYRYHCSGWR